VTTIRTGEVWVARLDAAVGHERGGRRPVAIVSAVGMNALPIDMVVVVPLTSHDRGLVTQPRISSRQAGLSRASFARREDIRSVGSHGLQRRLGQINAEELAEIRKVLGYFLDR
jgi:mRNA interferase MazF